MGGRANSLLALLSASVFLTASASAQEPSASPGAVVVRPVEVREVRVRPPAPPPPLDDQRPTFGLPRPIDPLFISRPILRPQSDVSNLPRGRNRTPGRGGYHSFKPRFNLGYGVVVGYPVIYPYAYPFAASSYRMVPPAPNTYSNVDSLPATSSTVTPAAPLPASIACEASAPCGGVSFDITPGAAQVYVDGSFAGVVEDFDAASEPLLLAPGTHYVEIRLAGYRTATFDVTITPGEVTPYQGTLERLRLRTQ